MLNQKCDPVADQSWIPSSAWRGLNLVEQARSVENKDDYLDAVPVMAATALGLEVLLNESSIDLGKVCELVLSDVGATIKILRLIGKEFALSTERPRRMVDCIANLDAATWFEVMSARTFVCDREHTAATAIWEHSRLVAQYAQLVAESIEGVSSEDAYLFGLLHEIKAIPASLGWPDGGLGAVSGSAAFEMESSLPLFVLAAMRSINQSSPSSPWKLILNAAHELAGAWTHCGPNTLHDIDSFGINSRWKNFLPSISGYFFVTPEPLGLTA